MKCYYYIEDDVIEDKFWEKRGLRRQIRIGGARFIVEVIYIPAKKCALKYGCGETVDFIGNINTKEYNERIEEYLGIAVRASGEFGRCTYREFDVPDKTIEKIMALGSSKLSFDKTAHSLLKKITK